MTHVLPRKKQKVDHDVPAALRLGQYESGSQDSLPCFHDAAAVQEGTPEPSGNLEAEATQLAVLFRRKRRLQELCEIYEAQLSGMSPSNPDRKRSFNQTRTISASEVASLSEPKIASSALRQSLQVSLPRISRLEQLAGAASIRELDDKKAIAVLCGSHMRYFVKSTAIDLGRSTNTLGKVDIDLTQEGDAKKVSRQQAHLALRPDGHFLFTNTGRRTVCVNGVHVMQHCSVSLEHLSLIDLAGLHLLFVVNHLAVHRLVARSQNLVL